MIWIYSPVWLQFGGAFMQVKGQRLICTGVEDLILIRSCLLVLLPPPSLVLVGLGAIDLYMIDSTQYSAYALWML